MMRVTLNNLNDSIFNSQHLFTKIILHKKEYKIMKKANQYKKEINKDIIKLRELKHFESQDKLMKKKLASFPIEESQKSPIHPISHKKENISSLFQSRSMTNIKKPIIEKHIKIIEEEKKSRQDMNINVGLLPNTFFYHNNNNKKNQLLTHNKSASLLQLNRNTNGSNSNQSNDNSNDIQYNHLHSLKCKSKKKTYVSSINSFNKSTVVNSYNLYHQSRNIIKENSFLCSSGYMKKKQVIQYLNMSKNIENDSRRMANQCDKINKEINSNEKKLSKITLTIIKKTKAKTEAQLFKNILSNDKNKSNTIKDSFWIITQRNKLQKNLNIFRNLNEEVAFKQKQYIIRNMHLFRDYSK